MTPFELLIVLEIIAVNIITGIRCCKKKYTLFTSITALALFTFGIIYVGVLFIKKLEIYGNGNGLFVIFGFSYIIPLYILLKESVTRIFFVICFSWVYTLGVFSIAVQVGKLLDPINFVRNVFIIETALFVIFTVPFNKIFVKRYVYILQSSKEQDSNWGKYLAASSVMHFFTLLCTNFVFSFGEGSIAKIIVVLLILATILFTNIILYQMIRHGKKAYLLDETIRHDALTGLPNRLSLFMDLEKRLATKDVFTILFLDLDQFKAINDVHGHIIGDKYLQHFATIIQSLIDPQGKAYRFGGDEFIIIYDKVVPDSLLKDLETAKGWDDNPPCAFNQVSIGAQFCKPPHTNIENLISQVDQHMYLHKNEKNHEYEAAVLAFKVQSK